MVVSIGVNERDGGTIYNPQLLFLADRTLIQHRRKITPTYHECMLWGQGDGSGLRAVDSAVGRIGQLACWSITCRSRASRLLPMANKGPVQLVENSAPLSWFYALLSARAFSTFLGFLELSVALLIVLRLVNPILSAAGGLLDRTLRHDRQLHDLDAGAS